MEIIIEIEDIKFFTYLAFILDQDSVVNKITEIRKCWKLDKELIPLSDLERWLKVPHHDFLLTSDVYDILERIEEEQHFGELYLFNVDDKQKLKEIIELDPLWFEVEYLLRRNGIDIRYKHLVLKGIVCGKITIEDWEKAHDSQTKYYHKDWIFEMPEFEKVYRGDTKSNIKRDREWYWLYNRGLKQKAIAITTSYRGMIDPEDFVETVKKGIKRYREFLESQGNFKHR